jgi:hypothetical protein
MSIHRGQVCLTKLTPALKRQAWDFIKANRPALAEELGNPESPLNRLARATQATVWVALTDTGLTPELLATGAS